MTITPWDLFYAHAAGGYLASYAGYDPCETTFASPEGVADYAAKCADAMMAERGKRIEKRAAELERERVEAYRAGLLDAAAYCDDYADGPHATHVSVARHLARKLREIADRCVRGVRLP